MSPSPDEDLNWLYGRENRPAQPERTQVMPAPWADPQRPAGAAGPAPVQTQTAPPAAPATPPSGYPAVPAYGPPAGFAPADPGPAGPIPSAVPKRTRPRHPVRNTFRVLLALVLVAVIWLVGVPAYAWSRVDRVNDAPSGQRPADQPGQTFLLVGSDSRAGLSKADEKKLGTGNTGGQRTDTIMLLYVPLAGKPALISIPRDSYVPIPKNGRNKINAAYAFGGPQLLVQTIETNTGLRVDGYLEIGFGGFVSVIDAVGGIRMCLPSAIKDKDSHINLPKGCQTLKGTDALGYVRMRKADPRGDLGRVERQRQMLSAVAKKAISPATVLNPVAYWQLCLASADAVTIGDDTSLFELASLGLAMKKISDGNGLTLTVPVSNPGASTPVGSAVLWDNTRAKAMFADIARGDVSGLGKYAK